MAATVTHESRVGPSAPNPHEIPVRCGRCTSFLVAIEASEAPVRLRCYCKRCGNKWTQVVPATPKDGA